MESISVVVVSYRTPALTLGAARSALAVPGVRQVVVIDNNSRDESADLLHALHDARLRVVVNATNRGYGTAANQGADVAVGRLLLFLNSDAQLTAEATTALADEIRARAGRAIVGARVVDPGGTVQRSAGLLPGPLDLTIRALTLNRIAAAAARFPLIGALMNASRIAVEYDSAPRATQPIETTMVTGACFAIGREAFRELGGFDERFFMYFEDADLCKRAAAAGMPIRYVPSAVVTHIGGASSSEDYHFGPLHARAMRQYLGKWYGSAGAMFALLLLCIRAVVMTLTFQRAAPRARRAFWAALRDEDPRR